MEQARCCRLRSRLYTEVEKMEEYKVTEKKNVGILYTLSGGICWGLSGCFGQYLFQSKGITADWLVTMRLVIAGSILVLLGLCIQKKALCNIWQKPRNRKRLVLFALAGVLVSQFTYFSAVQYSNAGTATVLQSLSSVMILVIVCLREKRLPRRLETGAMICALLGVFLLSTHGDIHSMTLTQMALIFGLASAVGAVAYTVLSGNLLREYGVYAVVGFAMLVAGAVMVVFVRPWRFVIAWDMQLVLALGGVAILGTAVAYSLFLKGVSIIGPFLGSLLGTVEPITAVIISLVFLKEPFAWMDMIGFALILGTVCVLSLKSNG